MKAYFIVLVLALLAIQLSDAGLAKRAIQPVELQEMFSKVALAKREIKPVESVEMANANAVQASDVDNGAVLAKRQITAEPGESEDDGAARRHNRCCCCRLC